MAAVTVRKVESRADFQAFFTIPWQVYKDDPQWVPPLLSMRRDLLSRDKNPAWEYMEGDYFTAWRGERCVGTIAAFVNHRHNEFHREQVGWFGAFEVENDAEAAAELLRTAEDWLRARGLPVMRGPQTFTTHEDVGLLIEGFAPPVILMPYHAPYYRQFIEAAGLVTVMDMHSYTAGWDILTQNNMQERWERAMQRFTQRSRVVIRPIDRKNLRKEFVLFKEVYNTAWSANWGFVPMTERELDALIEGLGLIFVPELACFAEHDGEAIGFLISVPDFNQVLKRAYPRPGIPEPLTLVSALWHWKLRPKITTVRVPLMGVRQAFRGRGVDLAMYYYVAQNLRKLGYERVDCGWILESNQDMAGTLKGLGMARYRTYRLYQKALSTPED